MAKPRRWKPRTRLILTLELAVVLPALALIGFTIWNLRHIQRDKVVEAAIQRDFQQILKIVDKRMAKDASHIVEEMRRKFPCEDEQTKITLERVLAEHPQAAHAFLYDEQTGWTFLSQKQFSIDPALRKEAAQLSEMLGGWMSMDVKSMVEGLRKMEEQGSPPLFYYGNWVKRSTGKEYSAVVFFPIPKYSKDRAAVGGVALDAMFLKKQFFPGVLRDVLAEEVGDAGKASRNPIGIMLHPRNDWSELVTSTHWDGGKPEVERNLEMAFTGLTLAAKYKGTTIEALSQQFLHTNLYIIIGLSVFLAVGIGLTYRNVMREMQLAKLKSDFVANVSHELRTPLALIRLYAETLELGRLSTREKYDQYYRIIRKESERLTGLINNILDFARIEAGRKEYEFQKTNLAELVRNTLEAYRYQIEQQGFAFQENIAEDVPPVQVDREAIARSLLNLVNNALKYSDKEKFLGVNLYRANGDVKLEVIDHGIGIPKPEQARIFENFYRAGDPLVHNTKGSGLGLSLVRHIVQAHGGQVTVESAPGRGSKFTIVLPTQAQPQRQPQPLPASVST